MSVAVAGCPLPNAPVSGSGRKMQISNKTEDPTGLTRNTSYYEGIGKEPGR